MPLEFQLSQHAFRFGLSEGVDPHLAPPGTLVTLENGEWTKSGRIQKRNGCTAYSMTTLDGTSITSASRLFTRGDELSLITGTKVYSKTGAGWRNADALPEVGLTWTTTNDAFTGVQCADAAVSSGGYVVQAWITGDATLTAGGKLFVQVSTVDGAMVIEPTMIDSATDNTNLRVVIAGTTAVVIYKQTTGNAIYARDINLSTMAVSGSSTSLRTDSANRALDACVIGSGFVVAYSAAGDTRIFSLTTGLSAGANTSVQAITSDRVSVDGSSGDYLYVGYATNTFLVRFAVHNPSTLANVAGPTTVEALAATPDQVAVCRKGSTSALIVYTAVPSSPGRTTSYEITSAGAVTTGTARATWGTKLQSKPVLLGSRVYAVLLDYPKAATGVTLNFPGVESTLVEIEWDDTSLATQYCPHRYVGKIDLLVGGQTATGSLPQISTYSSTSAYCAVPFLAAVPSTTSTWRTGLRLVNLTIGASLPADMFRAVTFNQETYIAGGVLAAYDGRAVFDYGAERAPQFSSYSASSPAGAMGTGTYLYGVYRAFRSAAGVLHRGPTATASTAALTGPAQVTWNFVAVNVSHRFRGGGGTPGSLDSAYREYIPVHRTVANGSTYYKLSVEPTYNTVQISPQSQTQTLVDGRSDTAIDGGSMTLATQPTLYTTGGILDDYQPPAFTTLMLHQSRLWGVSGDQRTIWFSKSFNDDLGVAPGFHPDFRVQMDATCTAMAAMDEKAILFSSDAVWYMLGEGPAPNGQNSDFQGPIAIQSDVGCTNPRSVVSTPDGVMFQSSRGLYLLTRGLELVWIGRAIKDQLNSFPNVTSAVLVPKKNQVRFTCNNAGGSAHVVLVYDYVEKQWSVFKYLGGSVAIADAVMHSDAYTFVTSAGAVYYEDSTTYLDAGSTWVTLKLETAWISSLGPVGFQSVRRFALHGVSNTNHDLSISVGFDGATTYDQGPQTFAAGGSVTTVGPLEACEIHIGNRRKCSSIRFKVEDATPTSPGTYPVTTGQGPSLYSMGIEVGAKKGFQKKPAAKRG